MVAMASAMLGHVVKALPRLDQRRDIHSRDGRHAVDVEPNLVIGGDLTAHLNLSRFGVSRCAERAQAQRETRRN
jgi:hypothetical protein